MFYDNFKDACEKRGTTITTVLRQLNRSTGATGRWSSGSYPTLDIVMEIAEYLDLSIDELVYGSKEDVSDDRKDEQEWLYIISRIPEERKKMCKDFLKTHMTTPEKYADKKKA